MKRLGTRKQDLNLHKIPRQSPINRVKLGEITRTNLVIRSKEEDAEELPPAVVISDSL